MENRTSVLVLGFYDRDNIGDECYKNAIPIALQHNQGKPLNIIFKSMDDIDEIDETIDIVICGGGDIINEYFMSKAERLLHSFTGRAYAVSVGVPYENTSKYLHMFDHVFVRSTGDYEIACREIGMMNVTYCGDVSILLSDMKHVKTTFQAKFAHRIKNIGIALTQPAFYNNLQKSFILNKIVSVLVDVYKRHNKQVMFHLIPFNTNAKNMTENDLVLYKDMEVLLKDKNLPFASYNINKMKPLDILEFIGLNMDMMLCSRYHSMMFSVITNTQFVALYTTGKADKLIKDLKHEEFACQMLCDEYDKPYDIDEVALLKAMTSALTQLNANFTDYIAKQKANNLEISTQIFQQAVLKDPVVMSTSKQSLKDVETACKFQLPLYLGISKVKYTNILKKRCALPLGDREPLNVARFICYLITGKTHHPTIWGLMENMQRREFSLSEAIEFIWGQDNLDKEPNPQAIENISYYPQYQLDGLTKRVFCNVNNLLNHDFADIHRAGWPYVVGGLMNFDASQYLRGDGDILLDTYVDRSFHWGLDTLVTIGVLPYKAPWLGFIHHTFDTTHSSYNCETLFKNEYFIASLSVCKGLIALSYDLASKLKAKLEELGYNIPVHNLCHPMLFVDNMFTPEKLFNNPNKAIVQIGAWLRNPYAIYKLDVKTYKKIALRGNEMEMYFAPPTYMSDMEALLIKNKSFTKRKGSGLYDDNTSVMNMNTMSRNVMCRDTSANSTNKFCCGVYDMLKYQYESVIVYDKLPNDGYDELLASNIVFLNLVDCSAVNTVIECIVRNTVIIINRLPALEEMLGPNYPGFYNTLEEAAQLCDDVKKIYEIYNYITKLDKTRYTLQSFLHNFHQILLNEYVSEKTPAIIVDDRVDFSLAKSLSVRIPELSRFLPRRFRNGGAFA